MRATVIIAAAVLLSCAPSNDDLLREAQRCTKDCDDEWSAWNMAEEQLMERERYRSFLSQCKAYGGKYVMVCDGMTSKQCYDLIMSERPQACRCSCVEMEGLR